MTCTRNIRFVKYIIVSSIFVSGLALFILYGFGVFCTPRNIPIITEHVSTYSKILIDTISFNENTSEQVYKFKSINIKLRPGIEAIFTSPIIPLCNNLTTNYDICYKTKTITSCSFRMDIFWLTTNSWSLKIYGYY